MLNERNFCTFGMKSNNSGSVTPENIKMFLKLDNKAINCKKTCFYKWIKIAGLHMTSAYLLATLIFFRVMTPDTFDSFVLSH